MKNQDFFFLLDKSRTNGGPIILSQWNQRPWSSRLTSQLYGSSFSLNYMTSQLYGSLMFQIIAWHSRFIRLVSAIQSQYSKNLLLSFNQKIVMIVYCLVVLLLIKQSLLFKRGYYFML